MPNTAEGAAPRSPAHAAKTFDYVLTDAMEPLRGVRARGGLLDLSGNNVVEGRLRRYESGEGLCDPIVGCGRSAALTIDITAGFTLPVMAARGS